MPPGSVLALGHTGVVVTVATANFPWNWDAVTAISSSLLVLGLALSVAALVQQRRADREQSKEAVRLQADAARRDLATRIMIDAFRVIIDAPRSRDDTFMEKIQNPLSMLQLVLNDDDIGLIREMITEFSDLKKGKSFDVGPILAALRLRIRENLGIDRTGQPFEYLRAYNPTTRSLRELVGLWLALRTELAGQGDAEVVRQRTTAAAYLVELLGERGERTVVDAIVAEWDSAAPTRRQELLDELGEWIRETQQFFPS
jgi:hypothetical protein